MHMKFYLYWIKYCLKHCEYGHPFKSLSNSTHGQVHPWPFTPVWTTAQPCCLLSSSQKNSKPTGLRQCSLPLTHKHKRLSNQQVQILPHCSLPNAQMPHLVKGSKREEKEMKKGDADWLRGVSLPLHCLVNQLTCSQRSLCERTLAVGQSDPRACLSPGGKWCPWYAASSRMHRQTGRLPAGPLSFFLSFFLPLSRKCPTSLHWGENYLTGP